MPELSKTYTPNEVEERWYAQWLERGCFTADPQRVDEKRPAYSIVIPPPNVTGILTLGHVLNNTIQDILARRARMLGKEVLWLPGTDHAGIATQNVVEKALKKDGTIKHRNDLGREKMVEKIWEWKEKFGGIILKQLRALGASCDWSRTRFTMDEEYSLCVTKVFVDLYQKGHIYRGKRMVNWCPSALTALSDEEVEMRQQNGHLYYFKVEVVEEPGTWLTIATTRPETIPGDTGIAVSPKDPRYAHLIGKHVRRPLPLENQAAIPIVADDHIDPAFGTGVLKVTPAHDKADFEIGQRHQLPQIDIMNPNGSMNDLAGADLAGLDRFEARKKAVELLRESGDLVKEEPYQNNVGYSERAGVPIEPRLSEQWFLKYPSVAPSQEVVAKGDMRFYPDRWAKVYDHWLGGIQDWCISRQIWWGHRVPVWYRGEEVYCGETAPDGDGWTQDPDVLDTWFSSWLWPFATMGWPGKTADLKAFYPTTDLVTGPDIIFFWVARMIMAGYEWMGEMPFKNVYFTGIIRDKQGRKMSKSLGNSPDPLELIASFGADALRFGIMRSAPLGADVLYDEKNVELGRNFCTKLWNAARFRQMQGGSSEGEIQPELLSSDDKWILARLSDAVAEVTAALEDYRFSDATATLYRFFWSEYCDWYVEASKAVLYGPDEARKTNTLAVMDFILGHTLRIFHPFLPFITEELWQGMGFNQEMPAEQGGDTIMFAPWPKPFGPDERTYFGLTAEEEKYAQDKQEVVNLGRGLKSGANIASNKKVKFYLKPSAELPPHELEVVKILLNAEALEVDAAYAAPKGTPAVLTPFGELFLPLEGLVDVAAERERVQKEIAKVEVELEKVRTKLADEKFTAKVPAKVLEDHRQRETDWSAKLGQLQKMLEALQ
jgi:valyl-tRNA synthetase